MTTRNFRVNNGLEVGDIVISASANTITGGATAAPSADGQFANKKYVDDQATETLTLTNKTLTSPIINSPTLNGTITSTQITTNTIVSNGSNADITIDPTGTGDINLTAGADVNIPVDIGLRFGDGGENIETDNTDFTITSGGKLNLAPASDVILPNEKGLIFGDAGEKIEGDGTDLTISSSGLCTITATGNTVITNNALISGNLVLTGNLTVNGATSTVSSVNTTIADNIIELNTGISASTNDAGIIIERGSTGNNAAILWDESADKFTMGTTTATAADKSGGVSVSVSTLVANLEGTATAAQYSDVAERFASDSAYTPGTVVALGGAQEITAANEEGSDEVFGVVSSMDQAAFKMNGGAGDDNTHPYIAMTGRVDVKVIGTVNKGDRLISASVPGYARAAIKSECTAFNVIGRALTSKTTSGNGSVLAAVRVSH